MNCDAISYLCFVATRLVALENFRFSVEAQYAIRVSPGVHSNARRFFFVALPSDGGHAGTRDPTVGGDWCGDSSKLTPPMSKIIRRFRDIAAGARPPAAEIVATLSSQIRRRRLLYHHAKSEQGHRCAPV